MKKTHSQSATPEFQVNESVIMEEQITQRVHELWQQRGFGSEGSDLTDWFQAESEINERHQERLKN